MSLEAEQQSPPGRGQSDARVVMIVEDEALIALGLEDLFMDEGYGVAGSFSSCSDALASLATQLPDVAVLDAMLKDGPCLELARELRRRAVPFIIYSGRHEFDAHPPELDGITWLEKPSTSDAVIRAVAAAIGARPMMPGSDFGRPGDRGTQTAREPPTETGNDPLRPAPSS